MIDKYVSLKRTIFKKEVKINYKLIDAYLMRTKNLIDGFNFLNLKQRKKIIRDFVSLKLFCDGIDITLENIDKEINRIFGKLAIERLFFYGDSSLKHEFIKKFKNEFNKLEKMVIENASKQE
jgi:hypothetical protein